MKNKCEGNAFVAIGASLGGISIAIVVILALFARESLGLAVPIVIALCVMGSILGYFAAKKK